MLRLNIRTVLTLVTVLVFLGQTVRSNFLSSIKPKQYKKGDKVDILVGQLFSPRSTYPFDWYKLAWCDSSKGHSYDPATVGVTMRDTVISESPFVVSKDCQSFLGLTIERLHMPIATMHPV